jgi:cbb3-type cytochrome oxidase subunit 1
LVQAAGWAFGIPVDQWSLQIRPYWFLREISGIMILLGQCIFAYNVFKTLYTPVPAPTPATMVKAAEVRA